MPQLDHHFDRAKDPCDKRVRDLPNPTFDVRFRPREATSANLSSLIAPQSPKIPRLLMRVVRTRPMLISSGAMSLEGTQHAFYLSHFPFAGLYLQSPCPFLKVTLSSQSLSKHQIRSVLEEKMAMWTSCRHVTSCFPMP